MSDSKIWPLILWDSEPRITVLARSSINLAVSQSVVKGLRYISNLIRGHTTPHKHMRLPEIAVLAEYV
jgi:hypothetical protein